MPRQKSKATDADAKWAALFTAEIARRETKFPANALTLEQIRAMRKNAGLACGEGATLGWLRSEKKAGRIKLVSGVAISNGRLNNTVRYILA